MPLFIQHQQLSIRRFIASDKKDFIGLVQHPLCMKYSLTGVLSSQQASDFFDSLMNNKKHKMYAIEEAETGIVIGCTGLQDCFIENDICVVFTLRLLPEFNQHQDLDPILQQLIDQLITLHQLPKLQAIVAKNNQFNMQLLSNLNFEKVKTVKCRGIDSYLYQTL